VFHQATLRDTLPLTAGALESEPHRKVGAYRRAAMAKRHRKGGRRKRR